jgi:hypothetical protein
MKNMRMLSKLKQSNFFFKFPRKSIYHNKNEGYYVRKIKLI